MPIELHRNDRGQLPAMPPVELVEEPHVTLGGAARCAEHQRQDCKRVGAKAGSRGTTAAWAQAGKQAVRRGGHPLRPMRLFWNRCR